MKYLLVVINLLIIVACNQQSSTNENDVANNDTTVNETATARPNADSNTVSHQTATSAEPFEANKLIIPGKSIGNIELGMDDSKLEMFGKPDMSDAAMGKAWLTWYGKKTDEHNKKTQLNVYTAYKDTSMLSKTVQQVRTTSSFFETANGIKVYSFLNDIQKNFPAIKKAATYTDDGRAIILYDAQPQGIAFEIAQVNGQQVCTGIIIHKPGIKVTQVYISLHPDMKLL